MKNAFALLLAALLLALPVVAAMAEDDEGAYDYDFAEGLEIAEPEESFGFEDEGYTGEWLVVPELRLEICLPDDWTELEPEEGTPFRAVDDTGAVTLSVRAEAEAVESLEAWAEANAKDAEMTEVEMHTVLVERIGADTLVLRFLTSEQTLIAFRFDGATEAALPQARALELVGSAYELWEGEEIPLDEEAEALEPDWEADAADPESAD